MNTFNSRRCRVRLIQWVIGVALACALSIPSSAQTTSAPGSNCRKDGSFTTSGPTSSFTNNSTAAIFCNAFSLTYSQPTGSTITALSVQLEGSDDNSTWTAFSGTSIIFGSNPSTSLSGNIVIKSTAKLAYIRVNPTSITGTGTLNYQLLGTWTSANLGGGGSGGSCGALGGDLSGTCAAAIVVGIEGAAIPLSAKLIGTNASRQAIAAVLASGHQYVGSAGNLPVDVAISGDVSLANTGAETVTGVNGAVVPLSAPALASNASRQLIAASLSTVDASTKLMSSQSGAFVNGDCLIALNGDATDFGGPCGNMRNSITNTGTVNFAIDASASTVANAIRVPTQPGLTTTANGAIGYDTTNNNFHAGQNSTDSILATFLASLNPTNANCTNWVNVAGKITLGDAGAPCGSGGTGGGGIVTYSGPTLSILSGTAFCPIGGGGACSATETNVDVDSPSAATISKMYVQLSTALGVGNSVAVTIRDNAADTTVTCTISGAVATSCNDTTHSFSAAAADLLTYKLVFTGTIIVTPTLSVATAFGTSGVGVTSVGGTAPINSTGGTTPVISATYQGTSPTKVQGAIGTTTSGAYPKYDATGNLIDSGIAAGNATSVNGASVPASANGLSSNGSSQLTASTAHNTSVPLNCVAASASGTAYTCTTTPSFTPAAGDEILFKADVASAGAVTLNVNSTSAAGVKKQGGGTALILNDLLASQWVDLIFDGTNWQMQGQTGNAASSGGSFPLTIVQELAFNNGASAGTTYTFTLPFTAASSGNTMFCMLSTDGGQAFTTPSGWTIDISTAQTANSRFVLMHKTSASDTTIPFMAGSNSFWAGYFMEVSGSHALDQQSTAGQAIPSDSLFRFAAITPTANSLVFALVAATNGPSVGTGQPLFYNTIDGPWKPLFSMNPVFNGGRFLTGYVGTIGATNTSTRPQPFITNVSLLTGSGAVVSTFSIL